MMENNIENVISLKFANDLKRRIDELIEKYDEISMRVYIYKYTINETKLKRVLYILFIAVFKIKCAKNSVDEILEKYLTKNECDTVKNTQLNSNNNTKVKL